MHALGRGSGRCHDGLAGARGSGDGNHLHEWIADDGLADIGPAGNDVQDAGRQPGLGGELGEAKGGPRSVWGRLQHHGVASGEGGPHLPDRHDEGEVPGGNAPDNADRPTHEHGGVSAAQHSRTRAIE